MLLCPVIDEKFHHNTVKVHCRTIRQLFFFVGVGGGGGVRNVAIS